MKILAIDVGGTHVKFLASGEKQMREFDSTRKLSAAQMAKKVQEATKDWSCNVVSIGYPGLVVHGKPAHEPVNLGKGWVGFDFQAAFSRPVKLINDAAMQALGSYEGGRMLFLGLGTGLGSAMIVDNHIEAMELAHLPYKKGRSFEYYVGKCGLERMGKKKWRRTVADVIEKLNAALEPEYVVLGGGNAKKLAELPPGTRLGNNANAFVGGFRLWDAERSESKESKS